MHLVSILPAEAPCGKTLDLWKVFSHACSMLTTVYLCRMAPSVDFLLHGDLKHLLSFLDDKLSSENSFIELIETKLL